MNFLEKEILGCILKDNTLINETVIQPKQFESESGRLLFQTMLTLSSQNKAIDRVTLLSENYDYIQRLGGPAFITELQTNGDAEHFESYEKQFIEEYKKRESERIVSEWMSKRERNNDYLINSLQRLDEEGTTDEADKNELLKRMADLPYLEDTTDSGIPSGLTALDALTGGFQKEESYILGARPSMGKTAVMLKFAYEAMKNDVVPLIFSLEMSKESLLRRLIASVGKINLFLTRNPHKLTKSKKEAWTDAVNRLYKLDFEIFDQPLQTIQHIRSQVRKAKRKHVGKQVIVFIDYLTLIHSTEKYHSDHAKFTYISSRLKAIAKEYDCPVITLAQLSRSVESRNDKRPLLSDLRESGSIEQDADVVMFLYRESYYNKDDDSNDLEIIVAKHRNGPTGTAKVYYNRATGIIGDLDDT